MSIEHLDQDEAGNLLRQTMLNPDGELWGQYGWSYPILEHQLKTAHTEIHESEVECEWKMRFDLMRYVCAHGYWISLYGIHNMIGSNRN